ncbi:unnamed protein product [Boreogadus saida]
MQSFVFRQIDGHCTTGHCRCLEVHPNPGGRQRLNATILFSRVRQANQGVIARCTPACSIENAFISGSFKSTVRAEPLSCSTSCLRCYLLDGISKGAWLNRSSIIFAGSDKWSVDPRVSIVSSVADKHEYSLQIQKVDVTDDGQYTCSIQSERNLRPKHLNLVVKGLRAAWSLAKVAWGHNSPPPPTASHMARSQGSQHARQQLC